MSLLWQSLREILLGHISEGWKAFWHDKNVDLRCNKIAIEKHHELEESLWGGYRLLATLTGQHPYDEHGPRLALGSKKVNDKLSFEAYFLLRYAQLSKTINETANTYFDKIPTHMQTMFNPVDISTPFANDRVNGGMAHYVKTNEDTSAYLILRNIWSPDTATFLSNMDAMENLDVGQLNRELVHKLTTSFWLRDILENRAKGLDFHTRLAIEMRAIEKMVENKTELLRVFAVILIAEECHYTHSRHVNNLFYFTKTILEWFAESSDLKDFAKVNLRGSTSLRIDINQKHMDLTKLEQFVQRKKRLVLHAPPPKCICSRCTA